MRYIGKYSQPFVRNTMQCHLNSIKYHTAGGKKVAAKKCWVGLWNLIFCTDKNEFEIQFSILCNVFYTPTQTHYTPIYRMILARTPIVLWLWLSDFALCNELRTIIICPIMYSNRDSILMECVGMSTCKYTICCTNRD